MTKPLIRALSLTTAIATLGIAATLSAQPAEAVSVIVDDFTVGQGIISGVGVFPAVATGPETNIIGGFRALTEDAPPMNVGIGAGNASYTGAALATSTASIIWDGNGGIPSGLGGRNLSSNLLGLNPRFTTEVANALNIAPGSVATLEIFEVGNATPASNTVDLTPLATFDQLEFLYGDFTLPNPMFDFGNVGAIRLTVTLVSTGAGAVPTLSIGGTQPLVAIPFNFQSTLGLLALGGLGGAYEFSKKRKKALNA